MLVEKCRPREETLQKNNVKLTALTKFQDDHLGEVLSCCCALADVCEKDIHRAEASMFRAGITVLALAQCAKLKGSARAFLEGLSASLGLLSLPDLFKRQMSPVLKEYRSECGEWGPASPEPIVLAAMLSECKWAAGFAHLSSAL